MVPGVELRIVDNGLERLIVTGMIVSDRFLRDVQTIYHPDLVAMPYARTVASWCLAYYKRFQKAPGVHIQDLYNSHARKGLDHDQSGLIGEFLGSISGEYERAEQLNVDYLLAQAEARFREVSLKNLAEDMQATLTQGDVAGAEALLSGYRRVERPLSAGINPLTDREAIYRAFEKREEDVLFNLPGDLGRFVGPIERSSFIGILAPEKRGKSWLLMQFALWAIKARCNVAFFVVGDMVEGDIVRRIHTNNARALHGRLDSDSVRVPVVDCLLNQRNECARKERQCDFGVLHRRGDEWHKDSLEEAPNYRPCTECRGVDKCFKGAVWHIVEKGVGLSWKRALELGKSTMGRSGGKQFKLGVHPSDSVNVRGLEAQLDAWEASEGFVPDVVVIDYADVLAPMDPRPEERHKQNDTWKALRGLSQRRYCSVVTATQADAASYEKKSLREGNFSEDKRKYGHVTAFLTLNQTAEEKAEGVVRIGQMFVRERKFDVSRHCTVLQCLDLGRPYVDSFM